MCVYILLIIISQTTLRLKFRLNFSSAEIRAAVMETMTWRGSGLASSFNLYGFISVCASLVKVHVHTPYTPTHLNLVP